MSLSIPFILLAIAIGMLMPIQSGVNSELAKNLNHPFQSAFISFCGGAFLLGISMLFIKESFPLKNLKDISPLYFTGGLLGSIFVFSSLFLISKIGATVLIAAFVTGQLLMSIIIDQFGILGIPQSPITLPKLLGCIFLLLGLLLIVRN